MKFLVLILAACALYAAEIRLESAGGKPVFTIAAAGAGELSVAVDASDAQPMLGAMIAISGMVQFTPRFPLTPGMTYKATWKPATGEATTTVFKIPKPYIEPTTVVSNVFPSTNVLPENQLKFYIHFSAAMSRGEAYKHIHLLKSDGKPVELPFLEIDEELWDRDTMRLTLLFDPGRIKRGVLPLAEVGSAIQAGENYRLIIDKAWRDANGIEMQRGFEKKFVGGPADRTSPAINMWRVLPPRGGSTKPLIIEFPEPMESALADRMISVEDSDGKPVLGTVELDRNETRWLFSPRDAWRPGSFTIKADVTLEDLAGNKLNRLFDVDVFTKVDKSIAVKNLTVTFQIAR